MNITKLKINKFRNYEKAEINLEKNINIFYGYNAQGKTNIIESIFLCSIGKSFRTNKDKEMININSDFCEVELDFEKLDRNGNIKIQINDKKNIFVNGVKIKKLSELLGKINIVIFTPDDIDILKGGPQNRRKFLDIMISQLRPNYVNELFSYSKVVEQRNNYLKQIDKDENLLNIWDEKLAEYAIKIFNYRKEFIEKIKNKINQIHNEITDGEEKIEIEYISHCSDKNEYLKALKERRNLDIIKGFTTKGVHRDDFVIYINNKEISIYGSQGQNRSAVLSLKISELKIIKEEIGENPILLLDDFMSELDKKRRTNFLKNIKDTQVIITCTDKIEFEDSKSLIYNVNNGKVISE